MRNRTGSSQGCRERGVSSCHLSDSLAVLMKRSLFFQKASLDVADVGPMVVSTRQAMQAMKTKPGNWYKELRSKRDDDTGVVALHTAGDEDEATVAVAITDATLASFETSKNQFLQAASDNLSARFPEIELVDSLGIFDPRNLPPAGSTELDAYGTTELEHLTDHFALFDPAVDGFPAVDEEHAAAEWVLL